MRTNDFPVMEELHPIPALNPDALQKICLEYILIWIKRLVSRDLCLSKVKGTQSNWHPHD